MFFLCVLCVLCGSLSCERSVSTARELVLYTSVDQPIAAPIIAEFEKQSGIDVLIVTDAEATKSVGLAERLRAEKANPQADVFWGNEIFHTINLAEEGIFTPYESPSAADIPAIFKDPQDRWTGSVVRVRVIVVSPTSDFMPQGLEDLIKSQSGVVAMARPTAGTTGGHVAAIYALWGEEKADAYFRALQQKGIKLLGGNSAVAEQSQRGAISMGLTDNDDVHAAQQGGPLGMILPDQDSIGTLVVPCTVGLVQSSDDAKRLVDYLLSRQVEEAMMKAGFAYASIRDQSKVKPMQVDYREVAKIMPDAVRRATDILEGRQ